MNQTVKTIKGMEEEKKRERERGREGGKREIVCVGKKYISQGNRTHDLHTLNPFVDPHCHQVSLFKRQFFLESSLQDDSSKKGRI